MGVCRDVSTQDSPSLPYHKGSGKSGEMLAVKVCCEQWKGDSSVLKWKATEQKVLAHEVP